MRRPERRQCYTREGFEDPYGLELFGSVHWVMHKHLVQHRHFLRSGAFELLLSLYCSAPVDLDGGLLPGYSDLLTLEL